MAKSTLTLTDIEAARERIKGAVVTSPCVESEGLSRLTGCRIFCKLDNLQRTGSFKERGARNTLAQLTPESAKRGVIAASAGNHALALAYHGRELGIPVTVVMPRFAPLTKVSRCKNYDADVIVHGDNFAEARQHADDLTDKFGFDYIHGFDDPRIIAGQGTIGLELLEEISDLDAVVIPAGGCGLLAGVALAIKTQNTKVQIIGVESVNAPGYSEAVKAGHPVTVDCRPTLADGLAVGRIGDLAFATAREHVDRVVAVDENAIALAIVRLMELEKAVVEGAGATPLAALLSGQLDDLKDKRVAILLCGGNIDLNVLDRIIVHGLVADGRFCRFSVVISDRPGGLAQLTQLIADTGASVKDLVHDRAFAGPDVSTVRVNCLIETLEQEHASRVMKTLRDAGYHVTQPAMETMHV